MSHKITANRAYQLLRDGGLNRADALILTAIGGAESGWNADAIGDVSLENATWGPSVGIWQIRTVKADTGKGGPRDINQLRGKPNNQAAAAIAIWKTQGRSAWSTYTSGAYKRFEGKVNTSATATGGYGTPATIDPGPTGPGRGSGGSVAATAAAATTAGVTTVGFPGGNWDPLNWPGAIGSQFVGGLESAAGAAGGAASRGTAVIVGNLWQSVQGFVITSLFAVGGIALVIFGFGVAAKPAVDRARDQAGEQATQLAPLAAIA